MTEFRPGPFESLHIVVKNLLIINALFFLAQQTLGATGLIKMEDIFGLHHVKSPLFQPWQLVTHLFLHGGIWHLVGNMLGLYMLGNVLEGVWGPKRFVTFYFLCGIGAGLLQLAFLWYDYSELINDYVIFKQHVTPDVASSFYHKYGLNRQPEGAALLSDYAADPFDPARISGTVKYVSDIVYRVIGTATIGASGAVFGIMAAFVYLFPNAVILIYFLFPIKAKWLGLLYFGYEVYSGIQNSMGDNIAHWAHVGGGLVGFLLVLTWNKKNRRNFY